MTIKTKKKLIAIVSVLLLFTAATGATLAWLTDSTDDVVNTFTYGDINIDLEETTTEYKMVPGNDIDKDPVVTVEAGSEKCWLFVKVTESDNFDDFMTYSIAEGWTALTGVEGVYYRVVEASTADQEFSVLAGDKVHVKDTVTKADFAALTDNTRPTLTFKAYAVQYDNIETAAAAWAKVSA